MLMTTYLLDFFSSK